VQARSATLPPRTVFLAKPVESDTLGRAISRLLAPSIEGT